MWSNDDRLRRRGRSNHITLLWRKKYIIKVTEENIYSAGIFSMVNIPSRNMSVIAAASGKKTSSQSKRQDFNFVFHKIPHPLFFCCKRNACLKLMISQLK